MAEVTQINKRVRILTMLFFLTVFIVSVSMIRAASVVELTPTSGEPGDTVSVEGTDFAASTSVGIGFGPEVEITDESVDVEGEISYLEGTTANRPIKPGSFSWTYKLGELTIDYNDNGNGTLYSIMGAQTTATLINYTTGFFSRSSSVASDLEISAHEVNYVTYEFDVTPAGLRTNSSGGLSGEFTVPAIWNGTEPVTVIDEAGNVAASDFTVDGSDVVPEPLTIGAIVLLSSAALVMSSYCLRKRVRIKETV